MDKFCCGKIAVMGPPNAGKSTLLNAFVGQKISVVTKRPQTTRNRILGIVTNQTSQLIFMDTPGIYGQNLYGQNQAKDKGRLNKLMIQAAWQSFEEADIVLLVLDSYLYLRKPEALSLDISAMFFILQKEKRPVIIAVNKIDLFHDKGRMLPLLDELQKELPLADIFPISALKHDGLDRLMLLLQEKLPKGEAIFPEDQLTTAPVRFMAAEIVREKLFERLRQELPYAAAVEVERWEEDKKSGQTIINAVIYVARASHKGIVIGKRGEGIKAIGTAARKDIMQLLGGRVHLELWVRVRDNWINDPGFLESLFFLSQASA